MLILQVCSGLISKWKHEFIFNGVEGLKLAYQGSRGYLSPEEKQQVLAWLKEKNSWNLKELEFRIRVHPSYAMSINAQVKSSERSDML